MNWSFFERGHYNYQKGESGMGYVYIVKMYLTHNIYIQKIGATRDPKSRIANLGKNVKICCVSKPHYNFFENEGILHEYYKKYRLPKSPNARGDSVPELFFIPLIDIFKTMPALKFETDLINCNAHSYGKKVQDVWYTSKKE